MASGYAALAKVRRKRASSARWSKIRDEALSDIGATAVFAKGQVEKADTAWEEYEAGYKELGGDVADIKKPGSFKRTVQQILPGGKTGLPEGEVRIGAQMYDRGQIQKAGSFLGSDAAAMLDEKVRKEYLKRTAPGRDIPNVTVPGGKPPSKGEVLGQTYRPPETPLPLGRSEPFQETEAGGYGVDPKPRGRAAGQWLRDFTRQYFTLGKGLAHDKAGELITDEQRWPGGYQPAINTYAHGGDFITNGPQKILVGDNPGGRERVTIEPLSSKNDEEYPNRERNLLESLYENNRRKKIY